MLLPVITWIKGRQASSEYHESRHLFNTALIIMASSTAELGNLVRLIPFTINDLPAHPAFEAIETTGAQTGAAASRPTLSAFIIAILTEAARFIDTTVPTTFQTGATKSSSPSTSSIQILKQSYTPSQISSIPFATSPIKRSLPPDILQGQHGESWFVRKSTHENKKAEGTANWEEMDGGLRVEHNENEKGYTPDIFDAYKVLDWDAETLAMGNLDNFTDIRMRSESPRHHMYLAYRADILRLAVYEMCHKLPFPLTTRVFPVLVVTALTGTNEGIVVHVPIDIRKLPTAFYSNGRNLTEGDTAVKKKKPVLAYAPPVY